MNHFSQGQSWIQVKSSPAPKKNRQVVQDWEGYQDTYLVALHPAVGLRSSFRGISNTITNQPKTSFTTSLAMHNYNTNTHLQDLNVREISDPAQLSLVNFSKSTRNLRLLVKSHIVEKRYLCANHADVTMDNFSRNVPKCCGLSVTTTTAFWTVDRVTSGDRLIRELAGSCLVQDIPNSEVARCEEVASRRRVK